MGSFDRHHHLGVMVTRAVVILETIFQINQCNNDMDTLETQILTN